MAAKEGNESPSWVDFKAFPFLFFIALWLVKIELPSVRKQLRVKGKEREGRRESRSGTRGGGGSGTRWGTRKPRRGIDKSMEYGNAAQFQ